jgi:ClpP class serine protease
MKLNRNDRTMAIMPSAMLVDFEQSTSSIVAHSNEVSVIRIDGPLSAKEDWFFDSYEALRNKMMTLCALPCVKTIVLQIDSPGGEAAGMVEATRELRSIARAAGKSIVSFVDGMAASAAYSLACAGEKIYSTPSSIVGSIGCIKSRLDVSGANPEFRVTFFKSGDRKADGNPETPLSDAEAIASQIEVDEMAELFFGVVAESRKLDRDMIFGLQAGTFLANRALANRLIDGVYDTLDQALAAFDASKLTKGGKPVTFEELENAYKAMSDEDKAKMKTLVSAEDKDPEEETPDPEEPKAAAEEPSEPVEPKAKAAKLEEESDDAKAIAALLATRPDLDVATRKALASLPLLKVIDVVTSLPKFSAKAAVKESTAAIAAKSKLPATPVSASARDPESDEEIAQRLVDIKLGKASAKTGIEHKGNKLIIHAMTPAEARAELARRNSK